MTWVETAEAFAEKADKLMSTGKKEAALSRYRAILDIPGASSLKDRAKERLSAVDSR
jgi:hypothetical protein